RPLVRAARPDRAELAGERLRLDVAGAGKGVELELPVSDDLRNDVRGGPESIHADSGGIAGLAQRAVADQTRAEQRRRRDRIVRLGNREAEIFVRYGVLGVAARQLITREERVRTEILLPGSAVAAPAAGPSEPWNADSLPRAVAPRARTEGFDPPDDLVPRNERQRGLGQFAVDDVQVR